MGDGRTDLYLLFQHNLMGQRPLGGWNFVAVGFGESGAIRQPGEWLVRVIRHLLT
jgi:hypothetical protein